MQVELTQTQTNTVECMYAGVERRILLARFVIAFFDRRKTCRAVRMGVKLPHEWWVRASKSESEHVARSYLVSDRPSQSTKNQNHYNQVVFFQPKSVFGPPSVPHGVLRSPLEHGGFPP